MVCSSKAAVRYSGFVAANISVDAWYPHNMSRSAGMSSVLFSLGEKSHKMSETMMLKRCAWAFASQQYTDYHDNEWGVPVHDDRKLFEMLILEGVQAGLSWSLILKKRDGYRQAFDGFDASKIARYDDRKIQELLANPEIVRNR